MAYDGRLWFSTKIDNTQIQKDLKRIETEIRKSQEKISSAQNAKIPLVTQLEDTKKQLDEAKIKLAEYQKQLNDLQKITLDTGRSDPQYKEAAAQIPQVVSAITEQQQVIDSLEKKWTGINKEVEKYDEIILKSTNDIKRNEDKAAKLSKKLLTPNQERMQKSFEKANNAANKFGKRLLEIGKSALIFNVISSGLRAATSYMGDVLKTNSQFTAQLAQLKGALLTAFQPIYEFILPGLNSILQVLTSIVQVAANVFSALFGKTATQSAKNAQALNNQASALGGVADAAEEAKKQLMGFDEINRLESTETNTGGGGGTGTIQPDFSGFDANQYTEAINRLIAPLKEIDFTALQSSLAGLGESFANLGAIIKDSLEWAWFEILVPLSEWTIEEAAPVAVDALASALDMLSEILGPVVDGLQLFWDWIQPIVDFVQETVILVFQKFREAFDELAQVFRENGPEITGIISNIGETLAIVWELIEPTMKDLRDLFGDVFSKVVDVVGDAIDHLIDLFYHLSDFVAGFLSQDWQRAWDAMKNVVSEAASFISDMVYGLQDLIGRIIDGILQAIYDVLSLINNWFGGGTSSGGSGSSASAYNALTYSAAAASMRSVPALSMSMQDIPYLAQGAVIPPNAPFMAVLGDQRNGTNIEAPLETIKQALAEVMAQNGGGDITINFTGDLAQLARVLYPEIHRQDRNKARSRFW